MFMRKTIKSEILFKIKTEHSNIKIKHVNVNYPFKDMLCIQIYI
jgi:hypothetical protein